MLKKLIWLMFLFPVLSLAAEFTEGKDYQIVTSTQIAENKSKVPVITEFFSYGCPWCYRIEAPLNDWAGKMGANAQLDRVPVVFKPDWELYAKAYYTAKTLALVNKVNPVLFKTIQVDKKSLATPQEMIQFFVGQGVDREIAKSAFQSSPTIDMHVKNGMNLMAQYQINAVPAFVINNKYKTDLQMAGNPERLFEILTFLMKQPT
jgi:thiol:disulfide interchange protein DsbA